MTQTKKGKPKRRTKKLSRDEQAVKRRNRKFLSDIQTVFINAGFKQVPTRNTHVTIAGRRGEIDNLFVFENVLVLIEDTTEKSVRDHINKTADFCSHLEAHRSETLQVLSSKFPRFKAMRAKSSFDDSQYRWIFLYCPLNTVDRQYETRHPLLKLLKYPQLRYFLSLSKIIGGSVRFEVFRFLGLKMEDIGMPKPGMAKRDYTALAVRVGSDCLPGSRPDGPRVSCSTT